MVTCTVHRHRGIDMARYSVSMSTTVSYSVEVEAEDEQDAKEKAIGVGLPGLMFLDHRYPDEGDWEPTEAYLLDEEQS
jgi:hypothetical protein